LHKHTQDKLLWRCKTSLIPDYHKLAKILISSSWQRL
jgi:hypothetical protein